MVDGASPCLAAEEAVAAVRCDGSFIGRVGDRVCGFDLVASPLVEVDSAFFAAEAAVGRVAVDDLDEVVDLIDSRDVRVCFALVGCG